MYQYLFAALIYIEDTYEKFDFSGELESSLFFKNFQ